MKSSIKLMVFAFLNISIIHATDLCPSSHCGRGHLTVHYPFKFEDEAPNSINCANFNLSCSTTDSRILLNLPHAGDFYLQKIDYVQRYIQLYDPDNCLTSRLFDLSLQSSPFKAIYDEYTLYVCPPDFEVEPVLCLSNSTNITIAVRGTLDGGGHGCQAIRSGQLPIYHDDTFFYLTWDSDFDSCVKCDDHKSGFWGSKVMTKVAAIAMTLPGLIIMSLSCCSIFCFHVVKIFKDRYGSDSAGPEAVDAPVASTVGDSGLDESKIVRCTELVVVNESSEGMSTADSNSKTCSICLENYCEKETVSAISKCGHRFHANCIHQWLGKNATCPVCRTSLGDDNV